ncbi:MAG TPA: AbrB/MazE/SpoVT family DNA-binding domain-containing protein [Firmicutes bacterium]|nr:AbrB/MazE/SpoVT family DNA-binding domain-containing protein [Bacillota bacterium]
MEIAKVTAKGQITIPVDIRKQLGIKEGDKVLFLKEGDKIIFTTASYAALEQRQAVAGAPAHHEQKAAAGEE